MICPIFLIFLIFLIDMIVRSPGCYLPLRLRIIQFNFDKN